MSAVAENYVKALKVLLLVNACGLVAFLWGFFLAPVLATTKVSMNYTELDRQGVINESALSKFHPSYGFQENPRKNVPDHIARPAVERLEWFTLVGLLLACVNACVLFDFLVRSGSFRTRKGSDNGAAVDP